MVFYRHILVVTYCTLFYYHLGGRWKLYGTDLDAVDDVGVGVWVHMDPPFSGSGEVRAAAKEQNLGYFVFLLYTL